MDSENEPVRQSINPRRHRRGRVVDAGGKPVGGALVAVVSGTAATPEIGHRTTGEGVFQVALPEGSFRLQAVAASGATGTVEVEGGEGGEIVIRIKER